MPLFYLHLCNGAGFAEDEEGTELPDLAAARKRAIEGLRDIMAAELRAGEIDMGAFVEIEDEDRRLLATISFEDAVRVTAEQGQRRKHPQQPEPGSERE